VDLFMESAGKLRCGSIFVSRQSSRLTYRKKLRECQRMDTQSYTNDLHEALLHKDSTRFWQCWRSKLEINNKCSQVEGSVDVDIIVSKFASHFKEAFSCNNVNRAESLKHEYLSVHIDYLGFSLSSDYDFDTELVSNTIMNLKRGKAHVDGLSAEHLQNCHPSLSVVMTKLFQMMILYSFVPEVFRYSYIVPIPKPKECCS